MAEIIDGRFKKREEVVLMKNKRLVLKLGKTVNMGNYENVRIDIEVGGDIGEAEFASAIEDLSDEAFELLEQQVATATTKWNE